MAYYKAVTNDAYPPLAKLTSDQRTAAETGTLITASDRLRREFTYAYDHARMSAGETAWRAPSITGFDTLLRRDYERARATQPDCPVLLSPVAQHALMRAAAPDGLSHLTALFEDAWQQLHAWQLDATSSAFGTSENTRCFTRWVDAVHQQLSQANAITAPQLASQNFPIGAEGLLHLVGFDVLTSQQNDWLDRARANGANIVLDAPDSPADLTSDSGTARRFNSDIAELTAAINWARAQLEAAPQNQSLPRIAIVVPNLLQQHATVARLLHALLESHEERSEALYNMGGGLPLAQHPLVESALLLLASIHEPTHYTALEQLLADPALPGINAFNRLPAHCSEFLRLAELPQDIGPEALRSIIRSTADWAGPNSVQRSTSDWWAAAASVLRNARWHTARNDSEGYQATNALLDMLIAQAPSNLNSQLEDDLISWSDAFALLASVAGQTLFAPASTPAPIQVLGYLEAIGLSFDHLWITGMSAMAWPTPVTLNPLLPPGELARAGAPRTSYAAELDFAERWLQRVTAHPQDCRASFVMDDLPEEDSTSPLEGISPLLAHWQAETPDTSTDTATDTIAAPNIEPHPLLNYWSQQSVNLHPLNDTHGTPPQPPQLKKATRRLQDQAACPMRGWSIHTLALDEPIAPHTLPNPMERGILLHEALRQLFTEVTSSDALSEVSEAKATMLCNTIAQQQVEQHMQRYVKVVRALEAQRVSAALLQFLFLERNRDGFFVNATEQSITGQIGPWTINLQIDRVDDVEQGQVVIDYKSNAPGKSKLLDDRLSAPQIPLYVLFLLANGKPISEPDFSDPMVQAGAFAEIKPDAAKYVGIRAENAETGLPGKLDNKQNWPELLDSWRDRLLVLANEISEGVAIADPTPGSCNNCHLHSLCRYHLNYE